MRTRSSKLIAAVALFTGLSIGGCVGTSAPQGWLPSVHESCRHARGAWAELTLRNDVGDNHVYGELIAVQDDTAFVLTPEGLTATSRDQLRRIKLSTYRSNHGALAAWTTLGTISTISHGVGLLVSFPVWLIFGSGATAQTSREPHRTCNRVQLISPDNARWLELSKYARFPQGIPSSVDRGSLKVLSKE